MKKISVLIPDGDDDRALIVVRNLAYSGDVKVHVLSPKNRNVFLSRHCTTHELFKDNEKRISRFERVIEISRKHPIDILFPIGESGIRFVHQYKESLYRMFQIPPIPDLNALRTVSDKWLLNEFLRKNSYPFVNSIPCKDQMNGEIRDISFPVLLKPRIGAGGIGIQYIDSRDHLSKTLNNFHDPTLISTYIMQEFLKGINIDLSVLCLNGEILAYSIQKPLHDLRNSFTFSRIIKLINNNKLFLAGKEILSSLKWSGVAHIDFIYDPVTEHFFMIDFNPRYWGTLTGSVIAGVNFPWLACQSALGNSFPLPEYKNTTYAIIKPKEIFRWMLGKKNFKGISFNSTNLRFVLKDPLPALNV